MWGTWVGVRSGAAGVRVRRRTPVGGKTAYLICRRRQLQTAGPLVRWHTTGKAQRRHAWRRRRPSSGWEGAAVLICSRLKADGGRRRRRLSSSALGQCYCRRLTASERGDDPRWRGGGSATGARECERLGRAGVLEDGSRSSRSAPRRRRRKEAGLTYSIAGPESQPV